MAGFLILIWVKLCSTVDIVAIASVANDQDRTDDANKSGHFAFSFTLNNYFDNLQMECMYFLSCACTLCAASKFRLNTTDRNWKKKQWKKIMNFFYLLLLLLLATHGACTETHSKWYMKWVRAKEPTIEPRHWFERWDLCELQFNYHIIYRCFCFASRGKRKRWKRTHSVHTHTFSGMNVRIVSSEIITIYLNKTLASLPWPLMWVRVRARNRAFWLCLN